MPVENAESARFRSQARAKTPRPPSVLPSFQTTFIGRKRELTELKRLLLSEAATPIRLLTLMGPGGGGKTRLAVRLASDLLPHFPEGVWHVELAALADAAFVPQAVAQVLGVREQPGQPLTDLLIDFLRPRHALLILDNCEHLLDACARLAVTLLTACPDLRLLTTSRVRLNVSGEMVWTVPALSLPPIAEGGRQKAEGSQTDYDLRLTPHTSRQTYPASHLKPYESVQLFVSRAQDVLRRFKLTDQNAPHVAHVCRRLDGIPLAIELAAARVKLLSVEQIAQRLDDALRLLTLDGHTEARHHTLRTTLDWSYDLLSLQEQVLLRRLSVFADGFTLDAAEAVASSQMAVDSTQTNLTTDDCLLLTEILDFLTHLVDKSLVEVVEREPGPGRYRLSEPVRQYAGGKLRTAGEQPALQARHLHYYAGLTEAWERENGGPNQAAWLQQMADEYTNVRAALRWAFNGGDVAVGLRVAARLNYFWFAQGLFSEGQEWAAQALARLDQAPLDVRPRVLMLAAMMAKLKGDYRRATALYEEALALYQAQGDSRNVAQTVMDLGGVALLQRDYTTAEARLLQGLTLFRELGDRWGTAQVLNHLGMITAQANDPVKASLYFEEALALVRELGDKRALTASLMHNLGDMLLAQGNIRRARALIEESLALLHQLGYKWGLSYALRTLARVEKRENNLDRAETLYRDSLALTLELDHTEGTMASVEGLATLAGARGLAARAVRLYGAASAQRTAMRLAVVPAEQAMHAAVLADARSQLDEDEFGCAWEEGQALTWDHALAYALETTDQLLAPTLSPGAKAAQALITPHSSPVTSLSRREREVAALVVQGLTNDDIAEQLYVSIKTVEKHIANILGKLGYERRAQIAAWAVEHGLANAPPDLHGRIQ